MKSIHYRFLQLTASLIISCLSPIIYASSAGATQGECDRACLNGFMDQYLEALLAHDPYSLPLTHDVKFTENTIRLNLGEELWQTATGLGALKVYMADPYSNTAAYFGVVMESGEAKLLAVRLSIKKGLIHEIETIVTRTGLGGDFAEDMDQRVAFPIWDEFLTDSERIPRLEMIKAVDLYFEGMENPPGSVEVPFSEECNRTENGLQTTNNFSQGDTGFLAAGCKEQFDTGLVQVFTTPERRFWMVDEERGIVVGMFIFAINGGHNAVPIAEFFKIKNGQIYEVEAIGVSSELPYGARSGW
jgi:hypothetical protein